VLTYEQEKSVGDMSILENKHYDLRKRKMAKRKRKRRQSKTCRPHYLPTPKEIAAVAAKIRKGWDRKTHAIRDCTKKRAANIEHKLHWDIPMSNDDGF